MENSNEELKILNEAPDFENQIQILEEEQKEIKKNRKIYYCILFFLVCSVLTFMISYSSIYYYKEYRVVGNNSCENVNIKTDGSLVPNINISEGNTCFPKYNIDYLNNRKATFNVDVFGDKSFLFNPVNQMDPTNSYCVLNCDSNNDGWPDYNIDIDGDKKPDINIVLNSQNPDFCSLNCDINGDTIPDTNIDTNNDGKPDINVTGKDDHTKPLYNIDYQGNLIPTFNIKDDDGNYANPVNDGKLEGCQKNCDIDGDGFPDYNIDINGDGPVILNELVEKHDWKVNYPDSKKTDWKCSISRNLEECYQSNEVNAGDYINIDANGDGIPDINIKRDDELVNPINKKVTIDNEEIILNYDKNNDGFPDYNIDIDNDGKPDLNITDKESFVCKKNCDTNHDGKPDYLVDLKKDNSIITSIYNINIDIDYDGICDVNCDNNNDLIPDYNIDTNNDTMPEINIDYDHDETPDYNIDTDVDYQADDNLDAYGVGTCNFNCNNGTINKVDSSITCTKNCDTNNDGFPDKYVDIDGDNKCDFNCNTINDQDNNYYLDTEYNENNVILDITNDNKNNVFVMNPLEIKATDIEPGWNGKYVLYLKNNTNSAISYKLYWANVKNEFTTVNNLHYFITRNHSSYLDNLTAPYKNVILKDEAILKANTVIKYVLDISFIETNQNQAIDSGKVFDGQLKIELISK